MVNSIQVNNALPSTAQINNVGQDIINVNFPPNAPLDFGTLTKMFTSLAPQSTPPAPATEGDVYLDDGTNTASNTMGLRRYNGTEWEDFGLQSTVGVAGLGDLSDVTLTAVSDGNILIYDAAVGKWRNQDTIDGGNF